MIRTYSVAVTTTGSAGSATGTDTTAKPVHGLLRAVYVDYTTMPATTDVTLTCAVTSGDASATVTFLTVTDANTDAWFYPVVQVDDTAGAAIAATYGPIPLAGYVTATVAQADAVTNAVKVLIFVEV